MTVYAFKPAAHLSSKLDPQLVGERIAALGGGDATPDLIVEEARSPDSPLHPHFTWDDTEAAHRWRRAEAGYLVRHVQVVHQLEDGTEARGPAFVSVRIEDEESPVYVSTVRALSDADLREQVLNEALDTFVAFRRRYQDLHELARIFAAIDTTAKRYRSEAKAA